MSLYLLLVFFFFLLSSASPTLCHSEEDCRRASTFCGGPLHCNSSSSYCISRVKEYDACERLRYTARLFNLKNNNNPYPVSILCVEALQSCLEVYYCLNDADCDDSLFCNGVERCLNGQCITSPEEIRPCRPASSSTCNEETRCGQFSINQVTASPAPTELSATPIYVIIVIFSLIMTVVVILFLIMACRNTGQELKRYNGVY